MNGPRDIVNLKERNRNHRAQVCGLAITSSISKLLICARDYPIRKYEFQQTRSLPGDFFQRPACGLRRIMRVGCVKLAQVNCASAHAAFAAGDTLLNNAQTSAPQTHRSWRLLDAPYPILKRNQSPLANTSRMRLQGLFCPGTGWPSAVKARRELRSTTQREFFLRCLRRRLSRGKCSPIGQLQGHPSGTAAKSCTCTRCVLISSNSRRIDIESRWIGIC